MTWQDLKDESTLDLIGYIRLKEQASCLELAETAFIAFTFRFNKEIVDRCRRIGFNWGYDTVTCDSIAEKVFERFWRYPNGFKLGNCQGTVDKCVVLYLFGIARNCFYDHAKMLNGDLQSPYDGTEEVMVELPGIDAVELSGEKRQDLQSIRKSISAVLEELPLKHRIIYLTYKMYEKEGFKLPRPLLEQLREQLNLSQNSIRVYKKEANDFVKKRLHEN